MKIPFIVINTEGDRNDNDHLIFRTTIYHQVDCNRREFVLQVVISSIVDFSLLYKRFSFYFQLFLNSIMGLRTILSMTSLHALDEGVNFKRGRHFSSKTFFLFSYLSLERQSAADRALELRA